MTARPMTRRTFLKQSMLTLAASFLATTCRSRETGVTWFELSQFDVTEPTLGQAFDGFRILHLTDIHYSEWMDQKKLVELKEFILSQSVDLIAVTGDSSYHTVNFQDMIEFYKGLDANAPVLMTWGNHDIWDDAEQGLAPVIGKPIQLVNNDTILFTRGEDQLVVAGLNCAYEELDDLEQVLGQLPVNVPAMLMAHEPDLADATAATGRFFLQLSGHSHGGQICLPNGYPPMLPWLGQRYFSGFYDVSGMMLYTSRGLGRGKPFIRWNCPAEAVILTLRCGPTREFKRT